MNQRIEIAMRRNSKNANTKQVHVPPGYHVFFGSHLWGTWRCDFWRERPGKVGACDTDTGKAFWISDYVNEDAPSVKVCRKHRNLAVAERLVFGGAPGVHFIWLSLEREAA